MSEIFTQDEIDNVRGYYHDKNSDEYEAEYLLFFEICLVVKDPEIVKKLQYHEMDAKNRKIVIKAKKHQWNIRRGGFEEVIEIVNEFPMNDRIFDAFKKRLEWLNSIGVLSSTQAHYEIFSLVSKDSIKYIKERGVWHKEKQEKQRRAEWNRTAPERHSLIMQFHKQGIAIDAIATKVNMTPDKVKAKIRELLAKEKRQQEVITQATKEEERHRAERILMQPVDDEYLKRLKELNDWYQNESMRLIGKPSFTPEHSKTLPNIHTALGSLTANYDSRDTPIEQLDLSLRTFNALKRTNITTVGEVLDMLERGTDAMLAIRNFGDKSLEELLTKLAEKGHVHADIENGEVIKDYDVRAPKKDA